MNVIKTMFVYTEVSRYGVFRSVFQQSDASCLPSVLTLFVAQFLGPDFRFEVHLPT
jgi:hypothetical protein